MLQINQSMEYQILICCVSAAGQYTGTLAMDHINKPHK
jgi:hypothetical protein